MARGDEHDDDVIIDHPNRDKASSKATRFIVALLLLVSAGLVAVISFGGWDKLQGAKPLQIAYILLYIGLAFMVLRWRRGVLPLVAALAIILGIFAAVSGPQWFDRDKPGFDAPTLDADLVGLLTLILVPIQALLIGFSMQGFAQAWNVEVERRRDGREIEPEAPSRGMPQTA